MAHPRLIGVSDVARQLQKEVVMSQVFKCICQAKRIQRVNSPLRLVKQFGDISLSIKVHKLKSNLVAEVGGGGGAS